MGWEKDHMNAVAERMAKSVAIGTNAPDQLRKAMTAYCLRWGWSASEAEYIVTRALSIRKENNNVEKY